MITNYKELARYLLYSPGLYGKGICVGIIGDTDISNRLTPEFKEKLLKELEKGRLR